MNAGSGIDTEEGDSRHASAELVEMGLRNTNGDAVSTTTDRLMTVAGTVDEVSHALEVCNHIADAGSEGVVWLPLVEP